MHRNSPVKYSRWYQPDEPEPDTPNPWWVALSVIGMALAVFGLLALVG